MKTLLALLLALVAATALVACGDDDDDDDTTPTPSADASAAGTPTPLAEDVCGDNPDPATAAELTVTTPTAGGAVSSPLAIAGTTQLFDGRLWFRAFDSAGELVFDVGASTNFGNLDTEFDESVEFTVNEATDVCLTVFWNQPTAGGQVNVVQIPLQLLPSEDESTETPEPQADACPANPDPATADETVIESPVAGDTVTSPLAVEGLAAAFEAVIQLALLDADGNELANQQGMTTEGQTLAPYIEEIEFEVTEETDGCLQVFMISANDSSIINVAQIPLVLSP